MTAIDPKANGKRRCRDRRCDPTPMAGVVLVITLLSLVLLAALVFYVLNLGRQVNGRIVLQHGADASVIAGAGWVARSMNLVAMNNVAMSRNLALVNSLDSLPIATWSAALEQTALRDALEQRLGGLNTHHAGLTNLARAEFQNLLLELNDEVAMLEPTHDYFQNSYDVTRMTHFNGPDGRGDLWRAMQSLDELSQATMENIGALAQVQAVRGGEVNLAGNSVHDAAALMMPLSPTIPWRRLSFDDLQRPVRMGLLPENIDHRVTNRGPYDTIFGWRHWRYRGGGGGVPGDTTGVDTGGASSPFGGGPGGHGGGGAAERIGYSVYGTQSWLGYAVSNFHHRHLYFSRFATWYQQQVRAKLGYLWDGWASRSFALPEWDSTHPPTDFTTIVAEPLPFSETAWFRLDIKSRYPRGHGAFLSAGSWAFENSAESPRRIHARVARRLGWWLPNLNPTTRMSQPEQYPLLNPNVSILAAGNQTWVLEYQYTVHWDHQIGLPPQYDTEGNIIPQTAYFVQVVIFGAVNRNPIRAGVFATAQPPRSNPIPVDDSLILEVSNPYEGLDRNDAQAPSPTDLDHGQLSFNSTDRRNYLTFLAVTRQDDQALVWPSRFSGAKPYPHMVALAQAQVFNNHSWDLWTQMWHVQLQPIGEYDRWLANMQQSLDGGSIPPLVSMDELTSLHQFLERVQPLEALMAGH